MIREPAIYARQSAIRVDSISVESQIEYCQYELKGEKCRIYIDKGFSGKDTDRPKFLEMMDAVKRGEINRIVCYKLDRISRSVIDFVGMMEVLHQYEAELNQSSLKTIIRNKTTYYYAENYETKYISWILDSSVFSIIGNFSFNDLETILSYY